MAPIGDSRDEFPDGPVEGVAGGLILMFRELYMEFFAIIVPGIVFFILLVPALMVPLYYLLNEFGMARFDMGNVGAEYLGPILFLGVVISYVTGHILFRHDPKKPDIASIISRPDEMVVGSCVEAIGDSRELFPYHALKSYLVTRGFDELAGYVKWDKTNWTNKPTYEPNEKEINLAKRADYRLFYGILNVLKNILPRNEHEFAETKTQRLQIEEGSPERRRSKHFINMLKLQIKSLDQNLYFEISRNETHIRLMSSLWYLSLGILRFSTIGIFTAIFAVASYCNPIFPLAWKPHQKILFILGDAMVFPIIAFLIAGVIINSVEEFIHYQRVREIVFVLQSWHIVKSREEKHKRETHGIAFF